MDPSSLTLYVAGRSPRAVAALRGLERLRADRRLALRSVEVVDVLAEPERARHDGVLVTPCLVAGDPRRGARVFGDLEDPRQLQWSLGLSDRTPS